MKLTDANLKAVSLREHASMGRNMILAWIIDRGGAVISFSCWIQIHQLMWLCRGQGSLTGWVSISINSRIANLLITGMGMASSV